MLTKSALSLMALVLFCLPSFATTDTDAETAENNFIQMRGQKVKLKEAEASRTEVPPTPRDNIPSAMHTASESPDSAVNVNGAAGGGMIDQARDAMKSMLQKQNEQEKFMKELEQGM